MLNVRLEGDKAWKAHLRRSARKFKVEKKRRLKAATDPIKRDVERNIKSKFRRRTGRLARGVKVRTWDRKNSNGAVIFIRAAFYGHFLEFGTKHINPKPFFEPAVKKNAENTYRQLGRSFKVL